MKDITKCYLLLDLHSLFLSCDLGLYVSGEVNHCKKIKLADDFVIVCNRSKNRLIYYNIYFFIYKFMNNQLKIDLFYNVVLLSTKASFWSQKLFQSMLLEKKDCSKLSVVLTSHDRHWVAVCLVPTISVSMVPTIPVSIEQCWSSSTIRIALFIVLTEVISRLAVSKINF